MTEVEAVEGLVEDEQFGVLDKGSGQEAEALLAAAQAQKGVVRQMVDTEDAHPAETGVALLGTRTYVETHGVAQPAGHDVDGREVLHVGAVHLGAYVADVSLYLPDTLARAAAVAEELYVTGVGLRIVGTDEREQRALSTAVGAAQRPSLALAHRPVQLAQDGAFAIADAHAAEAQYLAALLGIERLGGQVLGGQTGDPFEPLQVGAGRGGERIEILLARDLRAEAQPLDGQYVCDERRYLVRPAQDEDDEQGGPACQVLQHVAQLVACGRIESDEGVVENEDTWLAQERLGELELAQLTAAQGDERLVQQLFVVHDSE